MCRVSIQGLSPGQRQTICHNFPSYVLSPSETAGESDWICQAGRLDQPVGLPPELFAASGQYAPLKRRTSEGIEITGLDFTAHLVRGGTPPFQATLAVAREEELGRAFVLENFLRIVFAYHALSRGGVLLHSAGVVHRGTACLFSGRSNAGKTTLARKAAAAGALVLSDDINLVFRENDGYLVHRVPFTGEFRRPGESLSGSGTFRTRLPRPAGEGAGPDRRPSATRRGSGRAPHRLPVCERRSRGVARPAGYVDNTRGPYAR